jgi:Tol biopolymer transport system component/DNA-binding winged helix-turn-helix (wHTH) protein
MRQLTLTHRQLFAPESCEDFIMYDTKEMYFFGNFRVEVAEKLLFCDGKSVSITPKMFETLAVLLENAGKIVEKEELMQRVWHDRFVEENNLTFNIKMLRKVFGDDARNPTFIETIPRRGYRFIAELNGAVDKYPEPVSKIIEVKPKLNFGLVRVFAPLLLIVAVCSIAYAAFIWEKDRAMIPLLSSESNLIKITNSGFAGGSAISPDGKTIAYVEHTSKKHSVWSQDVETGKTTNLIPSSNGFIYYSLRFSNNGENLFFTAKIENESAGIYNFSLSDGSVKKVVELSEGTFSISPDNTKIAFLRYENKTSRNNKLLIADIDGKNEKVIREAESLTAYWSLDFSTDGKKIAAAYGHTNSGSQNMSFVEVDVETGEQREITPNKFFNIRSIIRLKDEKSYIISASNSNEPFRLWQVDSTDGICQPLSFDSTSYTQLGLNAENDKLSAVTISSDFHLYSSNNDGSGGQQKLAQSSHGFAYTADGRVVYSTNSSGNVSDIWVMNADGSNQQQLTTDKHFDGYPIISADNQYVYFSSNRTGETHVWRMKLDGTEQIQITKENGGYPMLASADGETLYYQKSYPRGIWQISLKSGKDIELIPNKSIDFSTFSPDGKRILLVTKDADGHYKIDLMELENKAIVKSFPLQEKKSLPAFLNWIPNTNSFSYVSNNFSNNDSLWIQNIDSENPLLSQNLGSEEIVNCKFSPDGKSLSFIRGNWKHDVVLISGLK